MTEQLSGACTTEIASFNEFTTLLADETATAAYDHVLFDTAPTGPHRATAPASRGVDQLPLRRQGGRLVSRARSPASTVSATTTPALSPR